MSVIDLILIAAMVLNFIVLYALALRQIVSLRWPVLAALAAFNVLTISLYALTQSVPHSAQWWFFNINFEHNFSSIISALLLLSISIMALIAAFDLWTQSTKALGVVWFTWGAIYLFLSYDETYMFHEFLENWKIYFAVLGVLLVATALYGGWLDTKNRAVYTLLIIGLGITAGGGILLDDEVGNSHMLEEFLELAGITIVFAAAFTRLRPAKWPLTQRLLLIGNPLWLLAMLIMNFWPLPALQARYTATPAAVDYLDGALSLIGYHIEKQAYQPSDSFSVTTYWRANRPLPENYAQSVRLLMPPSGEVMTQSDMLLGPPTQPSTNVWPVGFVFKKLDYIKTTADLPTPISYWLSVNVWRAPWDNDRTDNMLLVSQTNQELLLPDTVLLTRIAFVSPNAIVAASTPLDYRFDNGIHFTGYHWPDDWSAADGTMRFWWSTEQPIEQEFVQFLHLQDTDSGEYHIFDQPPLLNTFPTSDWPSSLQVSGEWPAGVFAELPEGQYEVFTGLYDQITQERLAVKDASGEPMLDHRIYLGTLTVSD